LAVFGFGQPSAAEILGGDGGHVGFDVEDGGAVEHVDAADMEGWAVAAEQFDNSEADGVGAARGARGEDAVGAAVGGALADELKTFGAVEDPQDEQVGEAFDVLQSGGEFREDFEDAFGVVGDANAFGDGSGGRVGAADDSDGTWDKHGEIVVGLGSGKKGFGSCVWISVASTGGALVQDGDAVRAIRSGCLWGELIRCS
jgi:hypothetical protein